MHTNFGAITLLLQEQSPGLEVLDPRTAEWKLVPPSPAECVVNTGNMLIFRTNEYRTSQVYSLFNVKLTYIVCVALSELSSAVCGAASSITAFLMGRTICGLGGCGTYTVVMMMLGFLTTSEERPAYLGLTGLTWSRGTVLGPIIGGVLALDASWRWGLYINLIFGAIAALIFPAAGFQLVQADTALQSGIKCFPLVIVLVVTIIGNSMATACYPWYQPWFPVGSIFGLAGTVFCIARTDQPTTHEYTATRSSSASAAVVS
ncbi:hypothetical protein BDW75DRAFT_242140 [Aspergillus navahoensis]